MLCALFATVAACRDRPAGDDVREAAARIREAAQILERGSNRAVLREARDLRALADRVEGRAQRTPPPQAQGGGPTPLAAAREQYAAATCERAQRCGQVGDGRRHDSLEACRVAAFVERQDDWDTVACTRGLSSEALNACLGAVRSDTCGELGSPLARLAACRAAAVCRP